MRGLIILTIIIYLVAITAAFADQKIDFESCVTKRLKSYGVNMETAAPYHVVAACRFCEADLNLSKGRQWGMESERSFNVFTDHVRV